MTPEITVSPKTIPGALWIYPRDFDTTLSPFPSNQHIDKQIYTQRVILIYESYMEYTQTVVQEADTQTHMQTYTYIKILKKGIDMYLEFK